MSGLLGVRFPVALVPYGAASSNEVQQYTSGLEVVACSFDTDFNCVTSEYILIVKPFQSIISFFSTRYSFGNI